MAVSGLTEVQPFLSCCLQTRLFPFILFVIIFDSYIMALEMMDKSLKFIPLRIYTVHLILHNLLQGSFAYRELRRQRRSATPRSFAKKVAITISAYQEDPSYLRQCLTSIRNIDYPKHLLSVVMIIDGNNPEDQYMMKIFEEVFCGEDLGTYAWKNNYHSCPTAGGIAEDLEKKEVETLIRTRRCVCIMQKQGGKREVMYTAFKALQDKVHYVQVCDSNIILDSSATMELVKVLTSNSNCGAVGGQVKIINSTNSYFNFMSGLSSWMDFNIERACQSFFNCVSCISGPLGMYRDDLLQQILEPWYHQTFLATFVDDGHLTNCILSLGYGTKYASRSICRINIPSHFLRWLPQWTRCSRSYIREWIIRVVWWPRYSFWIAYEIIVSVHFLVLVAGPALYLVYNCSMLVWLWLLICIQLSGLMKAISATILRQKFTMLLASLSSALYIAVLLPTQLFALITLPWTRSWDTSGWRYLQTNYSPLWPLLVWWCIIGDCMAFTIYKEAAGNWQDLNFLIFGFSACSAHWLILFVFYLVKRILRSRRRVYKLNGITRGWDNADLGIPGTFKPITVMGIKLEKLQYQYV
ncbi:hyaluronan synthase 1-like [Anolis sagrei]|uniref:hyaluronan synthase 1-like n=1 Tax=Anolis sagrei TaxID=38937 RepID=UPI00352011D0